VSKAAFDRKLQALEEARSGEELRKALGDRSNYYVAKAASRVARLGLVELIPDLTAAFDRFMIDAAKKDPQCWAKNAIVKALKDLGYSDANFFLRALRHFQPEAVWGGTEDTAGTLRGAAALALVACALPRLEILEPLADLLAADPAKTVRVEAALAIAQLSGADSALLLRFKALTGDKEPEVIGQCLISLLDISPDYIPFVSRFLDSNHADVQAEAAAALGTSLDPRAAATLIDFYHRSSDSQLRRAILLSLGASRSSEAADFLLSLIPQAPFDDAGYAVRGLAAGRFREDYRARAEKAVGERGDRKLIGVFEKEFASY
jgi:HEAT repeat protein